MFRTPQEELELARAAVEVMKAKQRQREAEYGVIRPPEPKSAWEKFLAGLGWLGKKAAGPLYPEKGIAPLTPPSEIIEDVKKAFGPPRRRIIRYEYDPDLGKRIPVYKTEVPIGTKIIEGIKSEWETDWPDWVGLGIGLATLGAMQLPAIQSYLISKSASKFAQKNLPVLRKKFPEYIKTAQDAKNYTELALKGYLGEITKSKYWMDLNPLSRLRITKEVLGRIEKLALTPPKISGALPAPQAQTMQRAAQLMKAAPSTIEMALSRVNLAPEVRQEIATQYKQTGSADIKNIIGSWLSSMEEYQWLPREEQKEAYNRLVSETEKAIAEFEKAKSETKPEAKPKGLPKEFGIQEFNPRTGEWMMMNSPGAGFATIEEAEKRMKEYESTYRGKYRIISYNYEGPRMYNVREYKQEEISKPPEKFEEIPEPGTPEYIEYWKTLSREEQEALLRKQKEMQIREQKAALEEEMKRAAYKEAEIEEDPKKKWKKFQNEIIAHGGVRPYREASGKTTEWEEFNETFPPRVRRKNGLTPDELATEMGFPDGDALMEYAKKLQFEAKYGKTEYMYSGIPLPEGFTNWIKQRAKLPDNVEISVEKAVNRWYADSNTAVLYGKRTGDEIRNLIKKAKIPPERIPLIDKYGEEPQKYEKQLNEAEKNIARQVKAIYDYLYNIAKQHGILDAYIENYVYHIYRDDPKKIQKTLYPRGGKLGTKPSFTLKRKIPTGDEAEKLGLHPVRDPALKIQIYTQSLYRAIANKQLLDILSEMKNADGEKLIQTAKTRPSHYVMITEPAFWKYQYVGQAGEKPMLAKMPVWAEPEVAKILNNLLAPYRSYDIWRRALNRAQGLVKRMIMYNPMIHGTNIFSDNLDECNFNFIKAFNTTFRGKLDPELMKELKFKSVEDLDLDMAKHGVAIDSVYDVSNELYENMKKLEGTDVEKMWKPLIALRDLNDKVLWQNIVLSTQRNIYMLNIHKLLKKNPDMPIDEAKELAAHYTNDLLGTLPSIVFRGNERWLLRTFLFARNWTVSNLRLITGAMGRYGTSKIIPGFLRHRGLTAEEADKLAPLYYKHLIKGLAGLITFVTVVNTLIKTAKEGKPSYWTPLEAEKGHELDIDTGLRDKAGRKIYIKPPLFRYIGDYIGYGMDINELRKGNIDPQTLKNKMEPLLKTSLEEFINYDLWRKRPITEDKGLEALKERVLYFLRGTTPYGTAYGVTQPKTAGWEKFIPLTGTWARHGISPEIYYRFNALSRDDRLAFLTEKLDAKERAEFYKIYRKQEVMSPLSSEEMDKAAKFARKIIDFRKEVATKWKDIEPEIDKLILKGDILRAINLMVKSGRYKTYQGILDRIRRVKGGVFK